MGLTGCLLIIIAVLVIQKTSVLAENEALVRNNKLLQAQLTEYEEMLITGPKGNCDGSRTPSVKPPGASIVSP